MASWQIFLSWPKTHELINSDIDMDGDTELALYLTRTVQALDIDWEAAIQPLTEPARSSDRQGVTWPQSLEQAPVQPPYRRERIPRR